MAEDAGTKKRKNPEEDESIIKKHHPEESPQQDNDKRQTQHWFKKRFELFSKFDRGIKLSRDMWYSVTPESVANKIADRVDEIYKESLDRPIKTVIDVCGGAGGNSIAFARKGFKVVYIDINDDTLQDASHNATVYKTHDIDFYCGDVFDFDLTELAEPESTFVFASPEWGGPSYKTQKVFDVDTCNPPVTKLVNFLKKAGYESFGFFLPRTSDVKQLTKLGADRIEKMNRNGVCVAWCVYWV